MKFIATALLISSFASFVFADDETAGVSITNPVLNTTAYLGEDFTITWTQTDTNVTTISSITLMDGDASSLATVLTNILDSSVAASALTYTWSVPSNLSVREDYALAFHGDNGYVSYSAYFSILDGNTTSSEGSSETTTAIPCCSSIA